MKNNLIILLLFILIIPHPLSATSRGIEIIKVNTTSGNTIELYKGSYALIIGNGNYINGWDPLAVAIKDVEEVAEALKRNGFDEVKIKYLYTMLHNILNMER